MYYVVGVLASVFGIALSVLILGVEGYKAWGGLFLSVGLSVIIFFLLVGTVGVWKKR